MPTADKLNQEEASLLRVPDGFRKIIIAADRYHSGYNEEGIYILGLYDFLSGYSI